MGNTSHSQAGRDRAGQGEVLPASYETWKTPRMIVTPGEISWKTEGHSGLSPAPRDVVSQYRSLVINQYPCKETADLSYCWVVSPSNVPYDHVEAQPLS